jgi:hypothetical protein
VTLPVRFAARPGLHVGVVLVILGVLASVAVLLLHVHQLPFTVCLFKRMTGLPCVTCGGTRALARLVAFDLSGAFAMNPLVTLGLLSVLPWAAADLWLWWRRRGALSVEIVPAARDFLMWAALGAGLANWAWLLWSGR